MHPKEKAQELLRRFRYYDSNGVNLSRQIAKICIQEIMYSYPTDPYQTLQPKGINSMNYWREVLNEIK